MFQDESLEPVVLISSWKKERSVKDCSCQTVQQTTGDVASQALKRKEKEVQTDEHIEEDIEITEDDSPEFEQFLRRVEPMMSLVLKKNWNCRALDDYEVNWGDDSSTVSNIHTLRNGQQEAQLQVTGLSWNCTGAVIAAAFGRFDHEDWCTHKSSLGTWNLDRRGLDPEKPGVQIDVPSCLMCIACHPKKPGVIAGGTFNGEVIVWDTSNAEDEPIVATSGINDDTHREPVAKVQWIYDAETKKHLVMSSSSDGKILVWKFHLKKPILVLSQGFVLLTESLPRSIRKTGKLDREMGVTCMSFSKDDPHTFLVGSESGGVFKCDMEKQGTPARRDLECSVQLHSPVTFCFGCHHGPVYSVECSPFHRNLFLSCGTDNSIRINSFLQAPPVVEIEAGSGYLYAANWSTTRPMVFAVATERGTLLMYDLRQSRTTPVMVLEVNDSKVPVFTMQFNQAREKLLATGDGKGNVQIWQLNSDLTEQEHKEVEALDEIAQLAIEVEEQHAELMNAQVDEAPKHKFQPTFAQPSKQNLHKPKSAKKEEQQIEEDKKDEKEERKEKHRERKDKHRNREGEDGERKERDEDGERREKKHKHKHKSKDKDKDKDKEERRKERSHEDEDED